MRVAHIKNGIVVNTTLGKFIPPDSGDTIYREAINGAGIGWGYDGENFIAPPQPEPEPEPSPNWTAFNSALLNDSDWATVAALLPADLRGGVVSTAANGNAEGLAAAYGLAVSYLDSQGQSLTQAIKDSWQAIADANHIPVKFQ